MADSKLKLQIVTALDAAGIKATREQIDGLEKSLGKMNKGGADGMDKFAKKLGRLPGPIGTIGDAFEGAGGKISKFGGTAMAVIGAFKVGWEIGTWLNDNVVKPLFKIKDPIEELKKSNREAAKELERFAEAADSASERADVMAQRSKDAITREIQSIDAASNAWQKAARSKIAYMTAGQDVETQMLERHRFEDMIQFQAAGDTEGADQVSKIYDILQAQLDAKHQLKRFDEETLAIEEKIKDNKEKEWKVYEAFLAAQDAHDKKRKEYQKFEHDTDQIVMDDKTYRWYQRKARRYEADMAKLEAEKEKAWQDWQNYDTGDDELRTRQLQRAALVGRTGLAVDQAAFAYDQAVAMNGERLNFGFTEEFRKTFEQNSRESEEALVRAITEGVSSGIGLLLEVKE